MKMEAEKAAPKVRQKPPLHQEEDEEEEEASSIEDDESSATYPRLVAKYSPLKFSPSLPDFYCLLGVPLDADRKQIRKAYYSKCKLLHPDRVGIGNVSEELFQIQQAYFTLYDEARRIEYDLKTQEFLPEIRILKLKILRNLLEEQSRRVVSNMQMLFTRKLQLEGEYDGLVILRAIFGNLCVRPGCMKKAAFSGKFEDEYLQGPWIDVKIPLQCQVEDSKFFFSADAIKSLAQLEGFYNPMIFDPGDLLCLYVCYEFAGDYHEVTVSHCSSLAMPMRSHRLINNKVRGPFAPANVQLIYSSPEEFGVFKELPIEARHWRSGWLTVGYTAAFIGLLHCYFFYPNNEAAMRRFQAVFNCFSSTVKKLHYVCESFVSPQYRASLMASEGSSQSLSSSSRTEGENGGLTEGSGVGTLQSYQAAMRGFYRKFFTL